ncbi:hypothetical protein, partial [Xanthomonas arboricola]|uniref:hypothetical protein n=1 Tax=Xanthomonas arboricola TaxID=56448 RepID=UPI001EE6F94A
VADPAQCIEGESRNLAEGMQLQSHFSLGIFRMQSGFASLIRLRRVFENMHFRSKSEYSRHILNYWQQQVM